MSAPLPVDPRPEMADRHVLGGRCVDCGRAVARRAGRCERCGGELVVAAFGPGGTVWSSTAVHLPVGERPAGFVLVSVDLDGDDGPGPRVLTRLVEGATEPSPGSRVELTGVDGVTGDLGVRLTERVRTRPAAPDPLDDTRSSPALGDGLEDGDDIVVSGVGTSHFGRFPDRRLEELAWEAIGEAISDAGVGIDDIDAAVVGSVFGPPGLANRVLNGVGLAGIPVIQVEAACASGTVAFHEAVSMVSTGRFRRVLAVGVEHLSTQFSGAIVPEPTDPDGRSGLAMPALYALQANRYLAVHDVDPALLAHVAVKNKRHGAANPRAHVGDQSIDLERVLGSRPIAGPLTLLQCCPMTDGAAAAIVEVGAESAHRHDRRPPVAVVASRFATGRPWGAHTELPWGFDTVRSTASAALADAGLGVDDVDLFEVHDAFTIGEILTIEALGLAEPGGGADLTASGATTVGGPHPVNPSGGLLSRGHPLGATGLAQIAEVVWQLRGEADGRQVEGATIGLVETMGGGAAGVDANACVVAILRSRP